jgi:hypothetical protein
MGEADQFIKRVFRDETERATHRTVHFENAPEIATAFLTPDGLFTVTAEGALLLSLPAPWNLLLHQAVADFKMEGDHTDPLAFARAEFRRHACWVRHLERDPEPQPMSPERFATWIAAPRIPEWLQPPDDRAASTPRAEPYRVGPLTVTNVADGCYRIGPRDHPVLWIAANELPLHPALVPFLWARSGRALFTFVRWLASVQGVQPVTAVLDFHPMRDEIAEEVFRPHDPQKDAVEYQRSVRMVRAMLHGYPEAAQDLCQKANEKGIEKALGALERQFTRKLQRALTPDEHTTLVRRLDTHGPERLGDVVLDLDRDALEHWLTDPDAR